MKQKAIIIDLEGTLSDHSQRVHYYNNKNYDAYNKRFMNDPVNKDFVKLIKQAGWEKLNHKIILVTAKSEEYKRSVEDWLAAKGIGFIDELCFRDPVDNSPSVAVKKAWLEALLERFDIVHAYDDRADICMMYEVNNITCTQINIPTKQLKKESVSNILKASAELFEERDFVYGSSYKKFGKIVEALFPDGLELKTEIDFARWGILHMMLSKINRYCVNFKKGGHKDSLSDLITYTAMLQEIDENGL